MLKSPPCTQIHDERRKVERVKGLCFHPPSPAFNREKNEKMEKAIAKTVKSSGKQEKAIAKTVKSSGKQEKAIAKTIKSSGKQEKAIAKTIKSSGKQEKANINTIKQIKKWKNSSHLEQITSD
jgi:hypothetical protein